MSTTYTENYGLGKQTDHSDRFDMSVITENMDKIDTALAVKVEKIEGKQLSTEDYTTAEKEKLAGLGNYDDTQVKANISDIRAEQAEQNESIEELVTLEAEDRAALAEVVDSGRKNIASVSELSCSSTGFSADTSISLSAGDKFVISFDYETVDDCAFCLYSNDSVIYQIRFNGVGHFERELLLTVNIDKYKLYVNGSATVTNIMFCTAAAYKISPRFVPYRPSLDELAERVAALEEAEP